MKTSDAGMSAPSQGPPRWRHPATVLAVALGAMLAAQVAWLSLNQRPVEYDSAWYLEEAILLRRALLDHGWQAFLHEARGAFHFKAPGVSMAAALTLALVGEFPERAVAVSLAAWLVAAGYLYLLARRFVSSPAAALGALLTSAMPLSFSMARSMLVEASLTASVVAFLFHAAASGRLRRPGHVAALAAWGTAGLMVKVTFPAYVVVPALLLTLTPWGEARPGLPRLAATWASIAAVVTGAAAWLWYGANWRPILEFARSASFGPLAAVYAAPVSTYVTAALLHAASPWIVTSLAVLAGVAVARRPPGIPGRAVLLAVAWAVPTAVLLVTSSNRSVRFLAPVLPALALAVAAVAEPWLRRSLRTGMVTVALVAGPPLACFLVATVPTPLAGAVRAFVEAPWLGGDLVWYEGPPDPRPWPNAAIVAAAARAAGGEPPAVLRLNVDLPELNHNNLKMEAVLQRVAVVPAQIDQSSPDGALASALDGDLLLLQSGGVVAADFLNVQRGVVAGELATGHHPYREVASFEVPGGRRVTLMERRCEVEEEPVAGQPLANLEQGLELVSLEAARPTAGLVSVRTRYRLRSGSHPMLGARVEVADPAGPVLGRGDHPLCRRPRRAWPAGTVIEDTFLLPANAATPGLVLRLGLLDLRTGRSLRVERVAAGLASADGTAVLIPRWSAGLGPPSPR